MGGSGGWVAVGGSGPLGSSSVSLAGGDGRPEKRDSAGEEGRPTGEEREALGGKMKKKIPSQRSGFVGSSSVSLAGGDGRPEK